MTYPIEIMDELMDCVDRWIVGTLNYMGTDFTYYQRRMPKLPEYVDENGLNVMCKKELKPYL